MPSYKGSGVTTIGANKTALHLLTVSGNVRPRLTSFQVSTDGVPGSEAAVEFRLGQTTTAGTGGSTPTPIPCDSADPAARASFRSGPTAEPNYSTTILDRAFNPRLQSIWFAENQEAEIVIPATANAGLGLQCLTVGGGVGNFRADMSFRE